MFTDGQSQVSKRGPEVLRERGRNWALRFLKLLARGEVNTAREFLGFRPELLSPG